jgi:hypothetical protein
VCCTRRRLQQVQRRRERRLPAGELGASSGEPPTAAASWTEGDAASTSEGGGSSARRAAPAGESDGCSEGGKRAVATLFTQLGSSERRCARGHGALRQRKKAWCAAVLHCNRKRSWALRFEASRARGTGRQPLLRVQLVVLEAARARCANRTNHKAAAVRATESANCERAFACALATRHVALSARDTSHPPAA